MTTKAIRVAACADVHCRTDRPNPTLDAFRGLDGEADLLLIAGDLTTHGKPEEAAILADACRGLELPVYPSSATTTGTSDRRDELVAVLEEARRPRPRPLAGDRGVDGIEVGIVGAKGFVGGFAGSHLPDFGEPLPARGLRRERAARSRRSSGTRRDRRLPAADRGPALCAGADTLVGERAEIWTFLGTDRLAAPIIDHAPDLVVHGHAHAGTFEGAVGEVAGLQRLGPGDRRASSGSSSSRPRPKFAARSAERESPGCCSRSRSRDSSSSPTHGG